MLSKLILLLGAAIGVFIAWSCVYKNKNLLTPPLVNHTAETRQQVAEPQPQTVPLETAEESKPLKKAIDLKKPSFSYINTPAEHIELTAATADQEGNFTKELEVYCKAPLCTKSLHFENNIETISWQKEIFSLIDFMRQNQVQNAMIKIEQETVAVSGTFTNEYHQDAIAHLLSDFEDKGLKVNHNFTVSPPPETTIQQEEEKNETVAVPAEVAAKEQPVENNLSKESQSPKTPKTEIQPLQTKEPGQETETQETETQETETQETETQETETQETETQETETQETKTQLHKNLEDIQQKKIQQTQSDINALLKAHPIYFKHNSNELTLDSKKILDKIIDLVNKNTEEIARLRISGYTDASGPASYNKLLSQKRAEKVRDYLVEHHIQVQTLEAIGYGEEKPLSDNPYAKINRRVEIEISKEANND